jgi:hypothetical protein
MRILEWLMGFCWGECGMDSAGRFNIFLLIQICNPFPLILYLVCIARKHLWGKVLYICKVSFFKENLLLQLILELSIINF